MRPQIIHGVLIALLLLSLASPKPVFAAKKMQIQASYTGGGTAIVISGRVLEPNNVSVSNAVISIQVNNPQGTSIGVSIVYTNNQGVFMESFPLAPNYLGGNYTAYIVADKPGYDTSRLTLTFTISTPDFSIEISTQALFLRQGDSGNLTATLLSLRGFKDAVSITAINEPTGVTIQFNPSSFVPSGTATINVAVSFTAPSGNYTITVLAVSGSLTHKTSFQLIINQGPIQANYRLIAVGGAALIIILGLLGSMARSRRRRTQKEAALEDLLRQASADSGYMATARVLARLEELRAMGKVDESTYERLRREYEKRLEKSR